MDIEYKAWWAIKKLNLDFERLGLKRVLDINEVEELRNDAYLNSKIEKDILKKWHDQIIACKTFKHGDQLLLYDSKLHFFPSKLKSRWTGPFIIHQVHPNGSVDLTNSKDSDRPKTRCVKCTPMCASARVAPSNIMYSWCGYRSTGTGVLTIEVLLFR